MTAPDEDREAALARLALKESEEARERSASIIAEARDAFNLIRAHQDANHYAEKFRAIIRGYP